MISIRSLVYTRLSHARSGQQELQLICYCMAAMRLVNATRLSPTPARSTVISCMSSHSRLQSADLQAAVMFMSARVISDQAAKPVGAFSVLDTQAGWAQGSTSFAVSLDGW